MGPLFRTNVSIRRRDLVLLLLLLVGLAGLVLRAWQKGERAARRDRVASLSDGSHGVLERNQEFGARFLARQDPYFDPGFEPDRVRRKSNAPPSGGLVHGPYPPSLVWMAVPLAILPTPLARVAWASLQCIALLFCLWLGRVWTVRWWPELEERYAWIALGSLLLTGRYLLRDTASGGGNLVYTALALAGLELSFRGRDGLTGWPLGLGLVLKPNLAPLLLFFVARRRWRPLASTLGLAGVLFFLPGLYFGPSAYLESARQWLARVAAYGAQVDRHDQGSTPPGMPEARFAMNQSLGEALSRLFRPPTSDLEAYPGNTPFVPGDPTTFDVRLVTLPAPVVAGIEKIASVLLLLLTFLAARKQAGKRALPLQALIFLPLSLLLSPVTWKAHHVALLPFFLVLLLTLAARRGRPFWLTGYLLVYFALCSMPGQDLIGREAKNLFQALSVVTWCTLLFVGIVPTLISAHAFRMRENGDPTLLGPPGQVRGQTKGTPG